MFSVCNIWMEESHLSCFSEIWELPWEKDLGLFSICSLEKQQKHVIKPAFIEFYRATISVILGVLDSLHGLGASVEEVEKYKRKGLVVDHNNAITVTCSVWWGVTSPGSSCHPLPGGSDVVREASSPSTCPRWCHRRWLHCQN